jgi:hypothetical protein
VALGLEITDELRRQLVEILDSLVVSPRQRALIENRFASERSITKISQLKAGSTMNGCRRVFAVPS